MFALVVLLGGFAVLAAGMAFLISYQEMSPHVSGRRSVLREALRAGLATLAFFGCLIAVILIAVRP